MVNLDLWESTEIRILSFHSPLSRKGERGQPPSLPAGRELERGGVECLKYLKRLIALFAALICLLGPAQALAAFQAFVDRNPVAADESFTLMLKSDENLDSNPDLSVLKNDFDVLGQSRGSSIQIINGNATQSIQWQIRLVAKRSGQLTIPAINAGGQSTQPIVLNVTGANEAQAAQQSGELFVEVSAEPRTAYVQQQIIYTVRLYRTVNIGNGSTLSDPIFPGMDAVVERLGDDRSYQATHDGQAYAVIERRYAVYPQKSGQFTSAPVQFDGEIIEARRGGGVFMFDPFGQNSRHKRASSKAIAFAIKPVPPAWSGAQWLPASKLQLAEQWSENPPKFAVGEPITRTLVISAGGLTASQLPVQDNKTIDGFKLYPDQPALKNDKDERGVVGVRTQKIAIMPIRAGYLTLPAIEIKWWNINTGKEEVARLPARNITVLPGGTNQLPAVSAGVSPGEPPGPGAPSGNTPLASGSFLAENATRGWWPWVSLFLAIGWLATLIIWWLQARKKYSTAQMETRHQGSLSKVESQLKNCCMANNAPEAKSKLLAWAKLRWPQNPPASLTALARICPPALAGALDGLDRALYAKAGENWQGDNLWQLFNQYKPTPVAVQVVKGGALQPLYVSF